MPEVYTFSKNINVKYIEFTGPHKFADCYMKIQRLKDMGIDEHDARAVLSKENWDIEKATESLFS